MINLIDFVFHPVYNYSAKIRFGCPLKLGDLIRKKKIMAQLGD